MKKAPPSRWFKNDWVLINSWATLTNARIEVKMELRRESIGWRRLPNLFQEHLPAGSPGRNSAAPVRFDFNVFGFAP
jgi:hypothetical protein